MDKKDLEEYEAPNVTELGSLHDLTLQRNKYLSTTSDFHYQNGAKFSFGS
ncbi:MAG TPA: hypothetical protein VMD59_00710 [Acidimicrobiales bacterium]|nr:hypothetical protein [Acidimicrobiales bacterium]